MNGERQGRVSARIAGAGKLSGGVYEQVRTSGAARVEGDLEADGVTASGSSRFEGSVKTNELRTSGSCRVSGDVEARISRMSGASRVTGDVRAGQFQSSGASRIEGNLRAEDVRMSGSCRVGGDVEADRFEATGAIRIGGLLNADHIQIDLGGHARVREMGGSQITVRRQQWCGRLEVESIEGDEVHLEATRAQVVRGRRVRVGEGCQIETVEYSQSLEVSEGATVRHQVKTEGG